jgi:hypothetical protein
MFEWNCESHTTLCEKAEVRAAQPRAHQCAPAATSKTNAVGSGVVLHSGFLSAPVPVTNPPIFAAHWLYWRSSIVPPSGSFGGKKVATPYMRHVPTWSAVPTMPSLW